MLSLWSETVTLPTFPPLKKESIKTDVLIIGGGLAGILCAYQLQQADIPYLLVEANTICSGITKNTTAKLTSQHGLLYHKLMKQYGLEKTQLYLDANEAALTEYKKLCETIACDFEQKSSYVYSLNNKQLLEKDMVIEINTSSLRKGHSETMPGKELVEIYKECGGMYVTVGPDAH